MDLENMPIRCKACGESRKAKDIDVRSVTKDIGGAIMKENFQYCTDQSACRLAAQEWEAWRLVK